MFIWSKLGKNLLKMEVRTLARIKKVIWDQLLATKADIIQSKLYFHFACVLRGQQSHSSRLFKQMLTFSTYQHCPHPFALKQRRKSADLSLVSLFQTSKQLSLYIENGIHNIVHVLFEKRSESVTKNLINSVLLDFAEILTQ